MGTSGKVPRPWTHQEVQIWGGPSERWAIGKKSLSAVAVMAFWLVSILIPSFLKEV